MFRLNGNFEIDHIALAEFAELIVIAPATANVIGKMAAGIADDLLTTVLIAATAPVLICPAMNDKMYANPVVKENLARLVARGHTVLEPGYGELACRTEGQGRLPDAPEIAEEIESILTRRIFARRRILVTAGPTQEPFDPVRFITNYSSGKDGLCPGRDGQETGCGGDADQRTDRAFRSRGVLNSSRSRPPSRCGMPSWPVWSGPRS